MELQKRMIEPLPQPSEPVLRAIKQHVQRACTHMNLEARGHEYECVDCGYQPRTTFGRVTRWREDA